jgi:hypothetical protein
VRQYLLAGYFTVTALTTTGFGDITVCTENFIRVDVASESPKLAE